MSSTQPIGGYFELELREYGSIFHDRAMALNSGRNAFAYILKCAEVKKIYIPSYICPVLLQPLHQFHIDYEFYSIDESLEPDPHITVGSDKFILYINYFGLKNASVHHLTHKYNKTIIDNAHAFFDMPFGCTHAFYSPRKFFGVPDGGFVYTNGGLNFAVNQDKTSFKRCTHLLTRIELGAREGFSDFKFQEQEFDNRSLAGMSRLTKKILLNIDYEWVRCRRNRNFTELHTALHKFNQLSHIIESGKINGPMVYPFLCDNKHLSEHLHKSNIFTPTYWPLIPEMEIPLNVFESYLVKNLIPLPIDQRYDLRDMHRIVSAIKEING